MALSNRNYEEKRNYIRMKINTPIELNLVGSSQPSIFGTCKNLSGGGMLIEAPMVLPIGAELSVSINSSHCQGAMLKAIAKVNRIDTSRASSDGCCIGLEVIEMIK